MRGLASGLICDEAVGADFSADAEIEAMLRFERELAAAQAALGLIPGEAALAIARATQGFGPRSLDLSARTLRDGVPVPALVDLVRADLGAEHGRFLHQGATSQDVVDTGLALRLRGVFDLLVERLDLVLARVDALAADEGERPLMAQTRMQAALPFTVTAKLATWRAPLLAHRDRLAALRAGLPIQLGGPIGDGSSFGPAYRALRADLAQRLDLKDAEPWHADRTVILDVAQGLALVTGTLGKIGQDVALLAQSDRRAVRLSGAGGSSAMAHKQNPVGAEILVSLARLNAGLLGTLAQSLVHENERSGAAWTLEWLVLPQMAEVAGAGLVHARNLLGALSFAG